MRYSSTAHATLGSPRVVPAWLTLLSAGAAPLLVLAITAIAIASWPGVDANVASPIPLEIRAIQDRSGTLTPASAAEQLATEKPQPYVDTKRAETPFWFAIAASPSTKVIDLMSRHAVTLACWNASGTVLLGEANRTSVSGALTMAKAGFQLAAGERNVLCRGTFRGPARIQVQAWAGDHLERSTNAWHRSAGLMDGGGIVLAVFVMAIGLLNRQAIYLIFAAWLVANFRMAALSAGWDLQWFGFSVPAEWIYPMRQTTMAAYYCLSASIFLHLFSAKLHGGPVMRLVTQGTVWSTAVVLAAACFLPYDKFLPVLWVIGPVFAIMQAALFARLLGKEQTAVMMWFGAALSVTLFSSIYETIAAAFGIKFLIGSVNSVTAAITSSLCTALAVAQHVRQERIDRQRAEKTTVQALRRVQDTYRAAPVGLFTLSEQGAFVAYNPALAKMLGYEVAANNSAEPINSINWNRHFYASDLPRVLNVTSDTPVESTLQARNSDGAERWFRIRTMGGTGDDQVEGSLEDITEQRKAEEHLRWLADHDSLTRLLNRRGAETIMQRALPAASPERPAAVAYVDLSRFKLLNDMYGHSCGDAVLVEIAARMQKAVGSQTVSRIGGDEFLLVFENTLINDARTACERLLSAVRGEPYAFGDREVRIGADLGLVEVSEPVEAADVVATADRACREAKTKGGTDIVVYLNKATVFSARAQELQYIRGLESGSLLKNLYLEMQPIMSLQHPYDQFEFECLLRVRAADGNPAPIFKLIQAAESSGQMSTIDRWVFQHALNWLESHADTLKNTRFVCVNLSGSSMNNERFMADLVGMLRDFPRASQRICVEITETVALQDLENSQLFLERLRNAGAKVALDDFGAGYTNLKELSKLRADVLKVDGAFVKGINKDPTHYALVQMIVQLANELGMRTIAEWAEDGQTVETLANLGCHYAQGWAIAKPMAPSEILLKRSAADYIRDAETLRVVQAIAANARSAIAA